MSFPCHVSAVRVLVAGDFSVQSRLRTRGAEGPLGRGAGTSLRGKDDPNVKSAESVTSDAFTQTHAPNKGGSGAADGNAVAGGAEDPRPAPPELANAARTPTAGSSQASVPLGPVEARPARPGLGGPPAPVRSRSAEQSARGGPLRLSSQTWSPKVLLFGFFINLGRCLVCIHFGVPPTF